MTPKPTPLQTLQSAILSGIYDDKLDRVANTVLKSVRNRRDLISEEIVAKLQEDMKVRVKHGNFKPRYLAGLTGTVSHFDGPVVWIQLDPPLKRPTKTIGKIGVDAVYVEPLEDE